jgi:23S rRNA pseudouridine1911/1915/1917 synthase
MADSITFTVDSADRLDRFLARVLPDISRSKLAAHASNGLVLVDGSPQKPSFHLKSGMSIVTTRPDASAPHNLEPYPTTLEVLFEDQDLLVINKPRGLAVHPAPSLKEPSLVNALLARSHSLSQIGGSFRPGIVHRLDKDTTGVILVAKTDTAHAKLARQIESKSARRRYVAVVAGKVDLERFDVSAPIGRSKRNRILMEVDISGKQALTHFKRLALLPASAVLAADLETGRTHQIRVHLQSINHPVLGDRLYAPKESRGFPLQLHAAFLSFNHPTSGDKIDVYAPAPADFMGAEFVAREKLQPF